MSSVFNSQNIERMRVNGNEIALAKINGNVVFQKNKLLKTFFGDSKQDTTSGINYIKNSTYYNWVNNSNATHEKNDEYIKIIPPTQSGYTSGIYVDTYTSQKKEWKEDVSPLLNKQVIFSFFAKADLNRTIYCQCGNDKENYFSLTNQWQRFIIKTTLTSATILTFYSGNTLSSTPFYIKDIMLIEGTEDKPYEPYTGGKPSPSPDYPQKISSINGVNLKISNGSKELKIPINLQGNILAKVGDYADELQVYSNGDIKILKKTGNFILKGNENWIESSRTSLTNYVSTLDLETINEKIKYNTSSFCKVNYFSRVDISSLSNEIGFELYTEVNSSYKYLGISMDINKIKNIQDFKEWLSTNNTKFLYQLSELESSIKIQNIKEELNSFGDYSNIEIETTYE